MINNSDEYFMDLALKEARKAYKKDEVPVGCIIVKDGVVIAKSHNKRIKNSSTFGHAEMEAIKKANKVLNDWRLDDCVMYVTLEPCLMCAGAIMQSRLKRVVYGTCEPKFGAMGSIIDISSTELKFNHHLLVTKGILKDEASSLIKSFFKELREKNK